MNDHARGLLIQAALHGHPQAKNWLHMYDREQGWQDCALGVLHLTLHDGQRFAALACQKAYQEVKDAFDLHGRVERCDLCDTPETPLTVSDLQDVGTEASLIIHLQDIHGLDFLAIARKVGGG